MPVICSLLSSFNPLFLFSFQLLMRTAYGLMLAGQLLVPLGHLFRIAFQTRGRVGRRGCGRYARRRGFGLGVWVALVIHFVCFEVDENSSIIT